MRVPGHGHAAGEDDGPRNSAPTAVPASKEAFHIADADVVPASPARANADSRVRFCTAP